MTKVPLFAPANAHLISSRDTPISPQKLSASQSDGTLQWKPLIGVHEHVLKAFDELMDSVFTDFCITGNLGMQQPQSPETQNLKDLAERSVPSLE